MSAGGPVALGGRGRGCGGRMTCSSDFMEFSTPRGSRIPGACSTPSRSVRRVVGCIDDDALDRVAGCSVATRRSKSGTTSGTSPSSRTPPLRGPAPHTIGSGPRPGTAWPGPPINASASRVPIFSGLLSYIPLAQGPTPSPPKASQSLSPTGCTPSARAVSASPQPSATTRLDCELTVTVPNLVATFAGKAPEADFDVDVDAASAEASSEEEPQAATVPSSVRTRAPVSARRVPRERRAD